MSDIAIFVGTFVGGPTETEKQTHKRIHTHLNIIYFLFQLNIVPVSVFISGE